MQFRERRLRLIFLVSYSLATGSLILKAPVVEGRAVLVAQVPIEVTGRDSAGTLPDIEGKAQVLAACTQCHSLGAVVFQRKSVEGWEVTVTDMISRGAQVRPEEVAVITAYLARSFGPRPAQPGPHTDRPDRAGDRQSPTILAQVSRNPAGVAASLPEGPAREVIIHSCAECHGLNKVTEQRKDPAAWLATVKDMVRLGAKLRPEDVTPVVAYLASYFNRQTSIPEAKGALEKSAANPTANIAGAGASSLSLPDAEGKGLILAACVQCHGLQEVVGQRKSAEGWQRTVHDMVSRGAQVTWSEAEIIASYLGRHMSK